MAPRSCGHNFVRIQGYAVLRKSRNKYELQSFDDGAGSAPGNVFEVDFSECRKRLDRFSSERWIDKPSDSLRPFVVPSDILDGDG